MNSFVDVWENVCDFCRNSINEVAYNTWISTLQPVEMKEDVAVIRTRSIYQKNIVVSHYMDLLKRGFEELFGFPVKVEIIVGETAPVKKQPVEEDATDKYTFENFVVGSSNKFAHAASLAVANDPGHAYNPFFIYGNPGLGKTHLLHAIRNEIKSKNPDMNIVYTQGESFMNEIIDAIHNVNTAKFREKYREADVLFIDDIQFIAGKESTQLEFFNTFEALYLENKQIIVTSDRLPKDIQSLDERIRGRLEMGLMADIQQPDYETRVLIIRRKANLLNFEIPDMLVQFIANQLKSNVRQLEGIVNKIYAYSQLTNEHPTLSSVTTLINEIRKDDLPEAISVENIIAHVGTAYDVTPADICSTKQNAEIAYARHVAIYIAREVTGLPLKTIGKSFGRNHATVSASIKKIESDVKRNSRLRATIDDIIKNIKGK
jgi:chromosomal replication initiator protein